MSYLWPLVLVFFVSFRAEATKDDDLEAELHSAAREIVTYTRLCEEQFKKFDVQFHEFGDHDPFVLWQNFAEALGKVEDLNEPRPFWTEMANIYLNAAEKALIVEQQFLELARFKDELTLRKSTGTYQWYVLFCNRLTVLLTVPFARVAHDTVCAELYQDAAHVGVALFPDMEQKSRDLKNFEKFRKYLSSIQGYGLIGEIPDFNRCEVSVTKINQFNTKFDRYILDVVAQEYNGEDAWLTEEGFTNAIDSTWSEYTRKNLSVLGMMRNAKNDVLLLPYPFELDVRHFVATAPKISSQTFFPLGLAFSTIAGDGVAMVPMMFFQHDIQHYLPYFEHITGAELIFNAFAHGNLVSSSLQWTLIKAYKELYLLTNELIYSWIQKLKSKGEDPQTIKVLEWWSFILSHERTAAIFERINHLYIYSIQQTKKFVAGERENMNNKFYYKNIAPEIYTGVYLQSDQDFNKFYGSAFAAFVKQFRRISMPNARIIQLTVSIKEILAKLDGYIAPGVAIGGYTTEAHRDILPQGWKTRIFQSSPLDFSIQTPPHVEYLGGLV